LSNRSTIRVRHELRFRLLDVVGAERVTPHLIRITLGGEQLVGFTSLGFDDHVKVFAPRAGEFLDRLPEMGPEGPVFGVGGPQPAMRDYTPHDFDPVSRTLQLDFALHDAGPVTAWARRAGEGDKLVIGGPRSSFVVGMGFHWHLLIGDETALPAIRRRLAELPQGSRAVVLAEAEDPEDEEPFVSGADVEAHWAFRARAPGGAPSCLAQALAAVHLLVL